MLDRRQTPCQKLPGTYRVGRTHSMLTCQQRFSYTRLLSHPNAYLTPVIHASRHQHCEIPVLDASWHQRYEHTPLEANWATWNKNMLLPNVSTTIMGKFGGEKNMPRPE